MHSIVMYCFLCHMLFIIYKLLDFLLFIGINSLCLLSQYLQVPLHSLLLSCHIVASGDILHNLLVPVFALENVLIF